jgi:hypothetical protein
MKRRKFIILSGIGATAFTLPSACLKARIPEYDPLLAEPELLSFIWDTETMIAVGTLFRELTPGERTEGELVSALLRESPDGTTPALQKVNSRVQADYEENDLVMLEGWILSRTEARQCALLSLIHTS